MSSIPRVFLSVFAGIAILSAQQSTLPTPLQSGVTVAFALPPVSVPTLFPGTYSYAIKVPEGATRLEVNLNADRDADLYVRYGQPVANGDDGGMVVADYRSETVGGNESIVITGSPMPAGTYYIAIKVWAVGAGTTGYLVATTTVGCQYNLETSEISMTAAGGLGSISVISTPTCVWTAVGSAPWITVYSHASGISSGLVGFQVAVNTGGARIGVITIGGQVFTIRQAGPGAVLVPDNAQLISQFVAGGGQWSMDIFVTNVSTRSEGFTMTFYNADGTPRTMPIQGSGSVGSITRTLASGETQLIQTSGADALQQGWAVLVPNSSNASRLSGFAVFRSTLSTGSSEAIVPFMDPKQSRYVLLYDNANGFVTGAALANPSSTLTLSITATARDEGGQMVGSPVTIVLPPLGRTTFSVSDSFAGTGGQRGSIYLSGSAGLTGLGLRFSPQGTFTSFPLVTSPDIQ
ncbi:MAG: hypothetical protein JWO19_3461 [Bryobacterales bacterium]|nr:hypothetical protein [Bryobacterales bacterium]